MSRKRGKKNMDEKTITYQEFRKLPESERLEAYGRLTDYDKYRVRMTEPVGAITPPCEKCRHYRGFAKCDAFPVRIPNSVLGAKQHDEPCNGRDKIHFEEKPVE
jgi:hypothetical protein